MRGPNVARGTRAVCAGAVLLLLTTSALSAQTHTLVLVAAGDDMSSTTQFVTSALGSARAHAVYTTDAPRAIRLGRYLADSVLDIGRIPYDRAGQTDQQFARVLVDNALRNHPDEVVVLVVESRLAPVVVREASGRDAPVSGAVGGTSVYVITVTPKYSSVVSWPR